MQIRPLPTALPERDACEISPVLETGSPTPISTYWIPLHELITHWTAADTRLFPAPVAPMLGAMGHALFALPRETHALRLYTLTWEKQLWHASPAVTKSRFHQAVRHLHEAAHHWSRAACSLDRLLPTDLDPAAAGGERMMSDAHAWLWQARPSRTLAVQTPNGQEGQHHDS